MDHQNLNNRILIHVLFLYNLMTYCISVNYHAVSHLTILLGSGKTWLLKQVCQKLIQNKQVSLTATTGIATRQFPSHMKGTTIHSWAGLLDGRYTSEKLTYLIDNTEDCKDIKNRIISTDILIIDEISMLSCRQFETLDQITR